MRYEGGISGGRKPGRGSGDNERGFLAGGSQRCRRRRRRLHCRRRCRCRRYSATAATGDPPRRCVLCLRLPVRFVIRVDEGKAFEFFLIYFADDGRFGRRQRRLRLRELLVEVVHVSLPFLRGGEEGEEEK